jgi:outer membrane protein OmpA-like peptidoglycan-associated protein
VSDPNKPKPLPPDDFGATTPNIKIPKSDAPSYGNQPSSDWEKTNYNYSPKDLGRDDWNKTAFNTPKATPPPQKDADWGATQANINLPNNQYSQSFDEEDFSGKRADFDSGKTSVGINLPKNEPPKYQEPPSEKSEEETEEKKKGGIPGWVWASAGLFSMFIFALIVLLAVYFIFLGKTGFDVIVKGAPVKSDAFVDGSSWGVSHTDGTIRLLTLKAGQTKRIEIKSPGWTCQPIDISLDEAKDGAKPVEKTASCANTGGGQQNNGNQQPPPNSDCLKPTNFDIARQCAYTELDKLEKAGTWTVEQLLYAMNLYRINFDRGEAVIRPVDMKFIERAAGFMKKLPPATVIEIGGHTDPDGSDDYNMKLSDRRATSVRNALVSKGIASTMLRTKPYGKTQLIDTTGTPEGNFINRRIEYKKIG